MTLIVVFRCDQCGESFARLDNLLRHSARHKHGKIFDCSTCGKGFHRKVRIIVNVLVQKKYLLRLAKVVLYSDRQRVVKVTFNFMFIGS